MTGTVRPQPAPSGGVGDVWDLIISGETDAELRRVFAERREFGIRKYGAPVGWGDGRDALRDLTDELLDGIVYASRLRWRWMAWALRALFILATRGASLRSFLAILGWR